MTDVKTRISIVTVCYNSAGTISDTIESVLSQTLPPYEYIIIDGKSTDDTLEIASSYEPRFSQKGIRYVIVSEKDNGIYDAMNKGIALSSGDVTGIINSDDWYERDALETVADCFERTGFGLFYADVRMIMHDGRSFVKKARNRKYATSRDWNHPTTFIRTDIYRRFRYRNETLHDDYDLVLRLKKAGVHTETVNKVLANFRMNGASHERSLKRALNSCLVKYRIYKENGYSSFYFFECFGVELAKLIIG
ncbi:MAG: glycosyltransferase [Lachnospiraceae bacterium]|nr:glycosyltransferase [Lachnospiraceae bacterium]